MPSPSEPIDGEAFAPVPVLVQDVASLTRALTRSLASAMSATHASANELRDAIEDHDDRDWPGDVLEHLRETFAEARAALDAVVQLTGEADHA